MAPVNDLFANAIVLDGLSGLISGDTTGAGYEPHEPNPGTVAYITTVVNGVFTTTKTPTPDRSVWYKLKSTARCSVNVYLKCKTGAEVYVIAYQDFAKVGNLALVSGVQMYFSSSGALQSPDISADPSIPTDDSSWQTMTAYAYNPSDEDIYLQVQSAGVCTFTLRWEYVVLDGSSAMPQPATVSDGGGMRVTPVSTTTVSPSPQETALPSASRAQGGSEVPWIWTNPPPTSSKKCQLFVVKQQFLSPGNSFPFRYWLAGWTPEDGPFFYSLIGPSDGYITAGTENDGGQIHDEGTDPWTDWHTGSMTGDMVHGHNYFGYVALGRILQAIPNPTLGSDFTPSGAFTGPSVGEGAPYYAGTTALNLGVDPAGKYNNPNLLTGDDSTFASSLGAWSIAGTFSGLTIAWDNSMGRVAMGSMKSFCLGGAGNGAYLSNKFPVDPTKQYMAGAWVQTNIPWNFQNDFSLGLVFFDAQGVEIADAGDFYHNWGGGNIQLQDEQWQLAVTRRTGASNQSDRGLTPPQATQGALRIVPSGVDVGVANALAQEDATFDGGSVGSWTAASSVANILGENASEPRTAPPWIAGNSNTTVAPFYYNYSYYNMPPADQYTGYLVVFNSGTTGQTALAQYTTQAPGYSQGGSLTPIQAQNINQTGSVQTSAVSGYLTGAWTFMAKVASNDTPVANGGAGTQVYVNVLCYSGATLLSTITGYTQTMNNTYDPVNFSYTVAWFDYVINFTAPSGTTRMEVQFVFPNLTGNVNDFLPAFADHMALMPGTRTMSNWTLNPVDLSHSSITVDGSLAHSKPFGSPDPQWYSYWDVPQQPGFGPPDGHHSGSGNPFYAMPMTVYNDTGAYSLKITNTGGAGYGAGAVLMLPAVPDASFGATVFCNFYTADSLATVNGSYRLRFEQYDSGGNLLASVGELVTQCKGGWQNLHLQPFASDAASAKLFVECDALSAGGSFWVDQVGYFNGSSSQSQWTPPSVGANTLTKFWFDDAFFTMTPYADDFHVIDVHAANTPTIRKDIFNAVFQQQLGNTFIRDVRYAPALDHYFVSVNGADLSFNIYLYEFDANWNFVYAHGRLGRPFCFGADGKTLYYLFQDGQPPTYTNHIHRYDPTTQTDLDGFFGFLTVPGTPLFFVDPNGYLWVLTGGSTGAGALPTRAVGSPTITKYDTSGTVVGSWTINLPQPPGNNPWPINGVLVDSFCLDYTGNYGWYSAAWESGIDAFGYADNPVTDFYRFSLSAGPDINPTPTFTLDDPYVDGSDPMSGGFGSDDMRFQQGMEGGPGLFNPGGEPPTTDTVGSKRTTASTGDQSQRVNRK